MTVAQLLPREFDIPCSQSEEQDVWFWLASDGQDFINRANQRELLVAAAIGYREACDPANTDEERTQMLRHAHSMVRLARLRKGINPSLEGTVLEFPRERER